MSSDPTQQAKPCQALSELYIRAKAAQGYPPVLVVCTTLFTVAFLLQLKMNNIIPLDAEVPLNKPFLFRGVVHFTSDAAFPDDMPVAAAVFPLLRS